MSTLFGRLSDALDALRTAERHVVVNMPRSVLADLVGELADAAEAVVEASRNELISEALRDENGLAPTENAMTLLRTVIISIDHTDRQWSAGDRHGKTVDPIPTFDRYALDAQDVLRLARQYQ